MPSKTKSVLFFSLCFVFGLSAFFSISEDISIQRDPAAINGKVFQISSLNSEQIKAQISQKIKIFPVVQGKKSIQFSGFSSSLCKTYSSIVMDFEADGIAVAGEAPKMKITAPCESGQDPAEMGLIQIPLDKLLNEKPRNAEFVFDGFSSKIEFKNSADEWPKQWVLKSVHFKNEAGQSKSAFFERSIASNAGYRPIVLEF